MGSLATDNTVAATFYSKLSGFDTAGYPMAFGTSSGSDQSKNICKIPYGHAYTLMATFVLTPANGAAIQAVMVRNPWGTATYNQSLNATDAAWTAAMIK